MLTQGSILISSGESFTLSCKLTASSDTSIKWTNPEGVEITDMIKNSEYNKEEYYRTSELTVKNIGRENSGNFSCYSSKNEDVRRTIKVTVYGTS